MVRDLLGMTKDYQRLGACSERFYEYCRTPFRHPRRWHRRRCSTCSFAVVRDTSVGERGFRCGEPAGGIVGDTDVTLVIVVCDMM